MSTSFYDPSDYNSFLAYANSQNIANMFEVAAAGLFFYEYFLTLSREIRFIWWRKWSLASCLFLLNRYVVLCTRFIKLAQIVPWSGHHRLITETMCIGIYRFSDASTVIMYSVLALLASIRIYAIWNKDRRPSGCVLFVGMIYPTGYIYYATTRVYHASPPPVTGCQNHSALILSPTLNTDELIFILGAICNMLFESIVISLTWKKTLFAPRRLRQTGATLSGMAFVLFRDGTMQFSILLGLNALGFLTFISPSFGFMYLITDTMASMLISRLILNLRSEFIKSCGDAEGSLHILDVSNVQFVNTSAQVEVSQMETASGAGYPGFHTRE